MITHLKNTEIDRSRWDDLVMQWSGQPYGLSWWLDIVSPGWEALILNDYEAVMPLPVKRRFGLKYMVQPRFCQQLGVFGAADTTEFLRAIPYLSYDFNLNYRNDFSGSHFRWHTNYIISQQPTANGQKPTANCLRNIRKASSLSVGQVSAGEFLALWQEENLWMGADYSRLLTQLVGESLDRGYGILLGIRSEGRVVSAIFAVSTAERVILLAPVSDAEGKRCSAMFGIVNRLIVENPDKIIDCEGSMIPGVARFYRGFGAVEQNYRRIWRMSWRRKRKIN